MLENIAVRIYRSASVEYNCAETILLAGGERYGIDVCPQTLKALGPFGRGMQIESVCGALTGALSVIGLLFINKYQHESDMVEIVVNGFLKSFEEVMGTISCMELRKRFRDENAGCERIIKTAATNLEKTVKHYKNF
ncbi:MAG: C_GCAxxG_C_C family protein [Kosmotoga sp.]|nr:MAG: C_GCAxxG_C_C family protein [Kosmotoga sp.]